MKRSKMLSLTSFLIVLTCTSFVLAQEANELNQSEDYFSYYVNQSSIYQNIIINPLPILDNGNLDFVKMTYQSLVSNDEFLIKLSDNQIKSIEKIKNDLAQGNTEKAISRWEVFIKNLAKSNNSNIVINVDEIINFLLKDSYFIMLADLEPIITKSQIFNNLKIQIKKVIETIDYSIDNSYCNEETIFSCENLNDIKTKIEPYSYSVFEEEIQNELAERQNMISTLTEIMKRLNEAASDITHNIK